MGAARTSSGVLEVFARGSDNSLWHNWQSAPGKGPWVGWHSLGGSIRGAPSIVMHAGGGLEVFCRWSDGSVYHIWQEAAGWSGWSSLGGRVTADPVAFVNHDRRIEVFARGLDGQLWHAYQRDFFTWSDWNPVAGGGVIGTPAIGRDAATGAAYLFAQGADETLLRSGQRIAADSETWAPFERMAGPCTAEPCAAVSEDGRMEVFFPSQGGAMRHMFQMQLGGSRWSSPGSFAGILKTRPASVRNQDGRLEVFHIGTDRRLHNTWQRQANGNWSGWHPHHLSNLLGHPSTAKEVDGRLVVFAVADNGEIKHTWQERPSAGPWRSGSIGGQQLGGLGVKIAEIGRCALWESHYY